MDVHGKITVINSKARKSKQNLKQYREAKQQLLQRAKLLEWAVDAVVDLPLDSVLIWHEQ